MTPENISNLNDRNTNIINIVLKKISSCCPESVDIIGIAGSFATGQFDEKSDLDLCIITNNPKANVISKCFILNDIAFDIYCTPWEKMEQMSEYKSPYVTKLINLKIVYTSSKEAEEKYNLLGKKLQENMANTQKNLDKAKTFFNTSLKDYAMLMLSNNKKDCWFNLYQMAINIESGLFIINGEYIKKGIKDVPYEISQLKNLPENWDQLYKAVFKSSSAKELKENATKLAQAIKEFIEINYMTPKENISSQKITGTYEEIFSNWKNKVERSVESKDIYSQFMAMASCQNFYNEMNLKDIDILKNFQVNDLGANADNFMQGMAEWTKLYEQTNTPIAKYNSFDEFGAIYLK